MPKFYIETDEGTIEVKADSKKQVEENHTEALAIYQQMQLNI